MSETEMASAEQIRENGVIETPTGKTLLQRLREVFLSKKVHVQNFSVLIVVNFIVAGLGFAVRVKIANTLGMERFGLFAYGLVLGSYGAVLVRFGLDRTLVRAYSRLPLHN